MSIPSEQSNPVLDDDDWDDDPDTAIVGQLADEFLEKTRRGEAVDLDELCHERPDLLRRLRDFLSAMLLIEDLRPGPRIETADLETTVAEVATIGDYRIIGMIGSGGMGVVYEAEHRPLGRRVALKVLPSYWAGIRRNHERFRREARVLATLHHTNIVPILEFGEQEGLVFLAMPLIEGASLDIVLEQQRVAQGISPVTDPDSDKFETIPETATRPSHLDQIRASDFEWVARVGVQVAEALAHAHSRGIIHRDIKPSNLLIDTTHRIWVTDFGLARTDDEGLTNTGELLGTLRYMAPERMSGGRGDERTDVYELGATLYELLTFHPPFRESNRPQLIQRVTTEEPDLPSKVRPGIPRDLETIVLKAMSKEPRKRYPNAGAVADDLRRFLDDEPVQARRISPFERSRRWARRNPLIAGLSSSLIFVCALSFGVVLWKWHETEQLRLQERSARRDADRLALEIRLNYERLREADDLNRQAVTKAEERRWDDANALFARAIALRPDQAAYHDLRAQNLYAKIGLWDLAAAELDQAFQLQAPVRAWEYWGQAMLRLWVGDREGYQKTCRLAAERFQGRPETQAILETIRTFSLVPDSQQDMSRAANATESLMDESSAPWWLYVSGLAHLRAGNLDRAIERFRQSLDSKRVWPSRGLNHVGLAIAYARRGDIARAQSERQLSLNAQDVILKQLAAPSEHRWVVHYDLSWGWPLHNWDWLEWQLLTREAFQMVGQEPPEDPRYATFRARALASLRQPSAALVDYEKAIRLDPQNTRIQMEMHCCRANSLIARGDYLGAGLEFHLASQLRPHDYDLLRNEATAWLLAGSLDRYQGVCQSMVEHRERPLEDVEATQVVTVCVIRPDSLNDFRKLIPTAQQSRRWYPGAERNLGATLYRAGQPAAALVEFDRAEFLHKRNAWDWAFIAMSHQALGQTTKARSALESAKHWLQLNQSATIAWDERAIFPLIVSEAESRITP